MTPSAAGEDERRKREREESASPAQWRAARADEEARLLAEESSSPRRGRRARRRTPLADQVADDDKPRRVGAGPATAGAGGLPPRRLTPAVPEKTQRAKGEEDRRRGKLTLLGDVRPGSAFPLARRRRVARRGEVQARHASGQEQREKISREVVLPETITITDLANRMSERAVDIVKFFVKQGLIMKPGDLIDAGHGRAGRRRIRPHGPPVAEADIEEGVFGGSGHAGGLESSSGRHDHGPRRPRQDVALDAIRNANVVSGEAGGITQAHRAIRN